MREPIDLTREFKLQHFGSGEWVDEKDYALFEHEGIECYIMRICAKEPFAKDEVYFGGYFVGYCKVTKEHPLHGSEYHEVDLIDFECHGGLTFSEFVDGEYWIGFDCSHSWDIRPSSEMMREKYKPSFALDPICSFVSPFESTYKNLEFCIQECKKIAEQLKATS